MTWRAPALLWCLVLVPAAAAFLIDALRRRRRALERFAEARLLPTIVPGFDPRRQRWRAALIVLALACLAVALAGPKWGFHWEEVHREGVDIVIALDTSRSMLAEDVKPNRLERAKLAIEDLVKQLRGDRVGLVAFAGTAFVQCPLTLDHLAFLESLRAVKVGIIPKGGTALAEAISVAIEAFEGHQGKHQALILITDGEDHEGRVEDAAKQASERGIKIFTVGIGTPDGELIPVTEHGQQSFVKDRRGQVVKSRLDDATLQQIATTTGGVYVHAAGPTLGLDTVYNDYIGKMDKRELQSSMERRFEDRYQIPLLLALLLLALEPLLGDRRPAVRLRRAARGAVLLAVMLLTAAPGRAWLDPERDRIDDGNRSFERGQYDDAIQRYGEALVDDPDSALLNFNMGTAKYKAGKFDDAIASFSRVRASDDAPARLARTAYNLGNTQYRLGAALEGQKPQEALQAYAAALVAYRRALGADPSDQDAKFNYEFVTGKIDDLKKKLEQQQQEQQQQENNSRHKTSSRSRRTKRSRRSSKTNRTRGSRTSNNKSNRNRPDRRGPTNNNSNNSRSRKGPISNRQTQILPRTARTKHSSSPEAAEPDAQAEPAEDGAGSGAAGAKRDELSRQEAATLLDAVKNEELQPDEFARQAQGGAVAEPARDW